MSHTACKEIVIIYFIEKYQSPKEKKKIQNDCTKKKSKNTQRHQAMPTNPPNGEGGHHLSAGPPSGPPYLFFIF